jgi:hypothetical protein
MLKPHYDKPFYDFVESNNYYELKRHFFGHTVFMKQ